MLSAILSALFGCTHRRTTFPITPRAATTYCCCLDCGAELAYDLTAMRVIGKRPDATAPVAGEAREIEA